MKKIILFLILLFLTGCNGNINYTISIDEDFNLSEDLTGLSDRPYLDVIEQVEEEMLIKYNAEIKSSENSTEVKISLNNRTLFELFKDDNIKKYFTNFEIKVGKNYIISLIPSELLLFHIYGNEYKGKTIENFNLTVDIPFKVVGSNANEVKGTKYTWYIDEENWKDQKIYLEFNNEKYYLIVLKTIAYIIGIIILIGICALFVRKKHQQNNEV